MRPTVQLALLLLLSFLATPASALPAPMSEQELMEPAGATDTGIEMWTEGVRELEWNVPDDVSVLMFGCTVPGHFAVMHGMFRVTPPSADTASD